jgi:23S rRNA pseudouridine1911/1915/1917 synthase
MEKKVELNFLELEPERLDKYIALCLPEHTRSRIQILIRNGFVNVNGEIIKKTGFSLEKGMAVCVTIPPIPPTQLIPEDIPLEVIFENESVLVVNKPAGMVVHPSAGHGSGTLVHALLSYMPYLGDENSNQRPGIVHRLDKETSGLILIAKNEKSQLWLQEQFSTRKVEKTYLALVDGRPRTKTGKIEAPIYRSPFNRKKMAIAPPGKGRLAVTNYSTEKEFQNHTLLLAKPFTGRTHQIRVHLASIGCPIVGDTVYGRKNPSLPIQRHFLHAYELKITLLSEKEPRFFKADLPLELSQLLKNIPEKSSSKDKK